MSTIALTLDGEPSPAKPEHPQTLMTIKQYGAGVIFLLLLLLSHASMAAPGVEINQDRLRLDLSPHMDLLEDKQGIYRIEDVLLGKQSREFSPLPPTALFFGYTDSVFWLRFVVENRFDSNRQLILEIVPADIDYIDLYGVDAQTNQVLVHKRSGSAINFDDRDYDHPLYFFDIELAPKARYVYYIRLESDKNINARLHLSTVRDQFYFGGMRDWSHGFLIGALLLLGLMHLVFAFIFKYKAFAYYAIATFLTVILQASWDGYFIQFLDPDPRLLDQQVMLSAYLSNIFFLLFARSYLDTHQRTPLIHRMLTALIVLGLMGIPCSWLFDSTLNAYLLGLYIVPSVFLVFGLAVYSFMEGYEPARYFLFARTLTIIAILIALFADRGLLPQGFLGAWGVSTAAVLEGIIFLAAMVRQRMLLPRDTTKTPESASLPAQQHDVPLSAFCHELRTPISGVLGMSELLLDTALTDQQRLQVETIHNSGRALMEVANKMSDLAAIESGDLRLNETLFEISSIVESVVESARDVAERSHVELIYQIDESLAGFVKGDRDKLLQAINHLVSLGIRRLQGGELLLVARSGLQHQVIFNVIAGKDSMADSMLLPEDPAPTLSSADNLNAGIARRFIALMGGNLEFQFRADHGIKCHFAVALPHQSRNTPAFDGEQVLRGKSLMVIDDNETCCKIIEQQAIQWGMDVFTATGSKEALAILRSRANTERSFDILLVDYEMPGMNGVQLIQKIQQEKDALRARNTAFVILTGVSKMPSQIMQNDSGISAVFYKPLSGKNLKTGLIDVLQKRSAK